MECDDAALERRIDESSRRSLAGPERLWRALQAYRRTMTLAAPSRPPSGPQRPDDRLYDMPALMMARVRLVARPDFRPSQYQGLKPNIAESMSEGLIAWHILPELRTVLEFAEDVEEAPTQAVRVAVTQAIEMASSEIRLLVDGAAHLGFDDRARVERLVDEVIAVRGMKDTSKGLDPTHRQRERVNELLRLESPWVIPPRKPTLGEQVVKQLRDKGYSKTAISEQLRLSGFGDPEGERMIEELPPTAADDANQDQEVVMSASQPPVINAALDRLSAFEAEQWRQIMADPSFQALAKRSRDWDKVEAAVAEAVAPQQMAFDKLMRELESRNGVTTPEERRTLEALQLVIRETAEKVRTDHGWVHRKPAATPGELLVRLRGIKFSAVFLLEEAGNIPRPTDYLWEEAESLRRANPFLTPLPARPKDGRERVVVLVRWCESAAGEEAIRQSDGYADDHQKRATTGSTADAFARLAERFHVAAQGETSGAIGNQLFPLTREAGVLTVELLRKGTIKRAPAFLAWVEEQLAETAGHQAVPHHLRAHTSDVMASFLDPYCQVFVACARPDGQRPPGWTDLGSFNTTNLNESKARTKWVERAHGLAAACELVRVELGSHPSPHGGVEAPFSFTGNAAPTTEAGQARNTGGQQRRKGQKKGRQHADRVRELLTGPDPFEGTKTELAKEAGYTQPSSLVNVKNFDALWDENERKLADRRAKAQRRMDRGE